MFSIAPLRPLALIFLVALAGSASAAPRVLVSILPLHSLVAGVMQDVGPADLLLDRQQTPHAFSLRPSEARRLHEADVVFWIGPALERPLQRVLQGAARGRSVALIDAPGVELLGAHSGHDDGHGHADADGSDPHIWLSPANASAMVAEIANVLAALDPDNSTRYRANEQRIRLQLATLDRELQALFDGAEQRFAVFHDAYRYLEQRYGLHSVGSVTTHPERRPGAAHLSALRRELAGADVRCLFSEPQFDARMVESLGEGLDFRHAVLDPLGSDLEPGPQAYFDLMRHLARTINDCLRDTSP